MKNLKRFREKKKRIKSVLIQLWNVFQKYDSTTTKTYFVKTILKPLSDLRPAEQCRCF